MVRAMPRVPYDHYLKYDEVVSLLEGFAADLPGLIALESIGKSHEGRDIWMATLTDQSTGPHDEKPAFWTDGNIHATEVSACTTALTLIERLLTKEPEVLKTHTFYVVPRLNPDGAEWALADRPKIIRSSTRPYPYDEDDHYGLDRQDVDGDGRILSMRVKDDNGPWKIAEEEPRLMKRREPGETGGAYYRLLPEGLFHNWDGLRMRPRKNKEGLDMNRNFPSAWRLESEQYGAGPYPTSEPEVRAAVDAIAKRPNICGAVTLHTFSGVLLRPPSRMPDDDIPAEDVWTYNKLGKHGEAMTGYPPVCNHAEFRYHPKEVITGVFDDWMYEHRGVHAWTVEIWSPQRQAGITDYKYIDWFRDHPFEDDLKLLKWSDEKLDGQGYIEWKEFDHPQLGKVEIGGWDGQLAFRNPPVQYLEEEVTPLADWCIWLGKCAPRLTERKLEVREEGDVLRIRWAVQNSGFLPTNVTKLGVERKLCRGVVAEIIPASGLSGSEGSAEPDWLVSGKLREEAGQLRGWDQIPSSGFGWSFDATDDVAVFEWVVKKGSYELKAHHDRAGLVRAKIG